MISIPKGFRESLSDLSLRLFPSLSLSLFLCSLLLFLFLVSLLSRLVSSLSVLFFLSLILLLLQHGSLALRAFADRRLLCGASGASAS